MKVKIKKISELAKIPTYGTEFSAGADIYALLEEPITLAPNETVMIKTGFMIEIPENYVGLIYPRSGISVKRGLAPANKVGVIDSDYRGEVMVALHNHSTENQTVEPFERIAQLVIAPYIQASFEEVSSLEETIRGEGGFGSTGR